ncbi:MAG TPA: nucleotidyltransferase domain-containing protein [Ktedonobacteraceae bacterium]|nr:nucleotidyltransferase domain-containing protein [Ktedonobacteraceae bacterium]
MQSVKTTRNPPNWLDRETRALVKDIIRLLKARHPDLLAIILYGSVARHEERPLPAPLTA